jgi:hypothetical protein
LQKDVESVFIGTKPPSPSPVVLPTLRKTLQPTTSIPQARQVIAMTAPLCDIPVCPAELVLVITATASVNNVEYPCRILPKNLGQTPLCDVFRRRVENACCVLSTDASGQSQLVTKTTPNVLDLRYVRLVVPLASWPSRLFQLSPPASGPQPTDRPLAVVNRRAFVHPV